MNAKRRSYVSGNRVKRRALGARLRGIPARKVGHFKGQLIMTISRRSRSFAGALIVASFLLWLRPGTARAGEQLMLYVSPKGNDAWSGRLRVPNAEGTDGPLASPRGARNVLRKLHRQGKPTRPVRVEIADGVYRLASTLFFRSEDSGEKNRPITYAAAPGARPVISGGRTISGWIKTGSNVWKAEIPDVKRGKWDFRQLFVGGTRYIPARHPNAKDYWFQFRDVNPEQRSAVLERGDYRPWKSTDKVWITLMRIWDTSKFQVESVDSKTLEAHFKVPRNRPSGRLLGHWGRDARYYLENSLAFLDSPGEWFLDRANGVLYVIPLPGHRPGRTEVVAPAVDTLIHFHSVPNEGVSFLNFSGITFSHASWKIPGDGYDGHQADVAVGGSIEARFMRSCTFKDCTFEHLGRYALNLRTGCKDNSIVNCEFKDIGGGAVLVGEKVAPRDNEHELARNEILDCHIHHCGAVWHGSVGIWVGYASYTRIARNHIHELPYDGISVGWGFADRISPAYHNTIEYNHIHDVMRMMGDGGAIYTLGRQPGTVIRHNVIHDVHGWGPGGNGIYMDEGSAEILVENNLVARVLGANLALHRARRNVIRNNVFALAGNNACHGTRAKNCVVERNIFYYSERDMFQPHWKFHTARMDYNLYFREGGKPFDFPEGMSFEEWRQSGQDVHSRIADPRFVDAANGDFSLKADSPALKLGFKPLRAPAVGPGRPTWRDDPKLTQLFSGRRRRTYGGIKRKKTPVFFAGKFSGRLDADGRMAEGAWKDIKPLELRENPNATRQDTVLHFARVGFDGTNLCVFIDSKLSKTSRLRAKGHEWARNDAAEICFQVLEGKGPVFVVRGYADGFLESVAEAGAPARTARMLGNASRFGSVVGNGAWTGEWKIPLSAAGIDPRKTRKLRFNIAVRRAVERKWALLVGTGMESWRLKYAGILVLPDARK